MIVVQIGDQLQSTIYLWRLSRVDPLSIFALALQGSTKTREHRRVIDFIRSSMSDVPVKCHCR